MEGKRYAVIRIRGRQYKVSEGDEILVDKLAEGEVKPEILLFVDGDKVLVGKPLVEKVKVQLSVVSPEEKGDKIRVQTYKAKSRYRKTKGFRPRYTRLRVGKIG